ncbi:MAG: anti-sigma factor family protein [Longimicrobiales bacterium]
MDRYSDRLSDYLDGELGSAAHVEVESHLEECAECAALLRDLDTIRARAGALPQRPPERDLWPAIAARLGTRGLLRFQPRAEQNRRRVSLTVPQLAAAGVVLTLLSGAAVREWLVRTADTPDGVATTAPAAPAQTATGAELVSLVAPAEPAVEPLETAAAELEAALLAERSALDPHTVEVLESNLRLIDDAIAEIRAALENDPADLYLNRALANAMRRKLDVLRVTAVSAEIAI